MDEDGTGEPPRRGRPENRPARGDRSPGDRNERRGRTGASGERRRPGRSGDRPNRGPRDAEGASFRILSELSVLEKALSTGDFAKQKQPLEEILRQLKPLRLRSLDDLDFNTRGRLLTTLLRVTRQKKPPEPKAAAPEPSPPAVSADPIAEPAQSPSDAVEAAAPDVAAEPQVAPPAAGPDAPEMQIAPPAVEPDAPQIQAAPEPPPASTSAETAPAEVGSPAMQGQAVEVPKQVRSLSPEEERLAAYRDAIFLVGSVWRAVGDEVRAAPAFAASGRKFEEREPTKTARPPGDWRDEAKLLENQKRTQDAARLHERHDSPAEAARLYEASGDPKSALRSLLAAKDLLAARHLLKRLKPEQFLPIIERAGAYELLMEHYVEAGDFESVAKLYERARQFDQAAIAWEKGGKLAAARKAYERAKDSANAERIRQLEVEKLIERGDRLGAALLLVAAGKREEAAQTLTALPAAKAFRFLQKVNLDGEALALARKEIARAEAENKPGGSARWLEMLGDAPAAAEAWERAERKDRALALYEEVGNWQRAAELAESLGQRDKAVELYHRAGDKASADRVASLPAQVATPPPSGSAVALQGEGEEG